MMGERVQVVERASGQLVEATLHEGLTTRDLEVIERSWAAHRAELVAALMGAGVERRLWPESLHWDWGRKAPLLELLLVNAFGVACRGGWQAVMMTKTAGYDARVSSEAGKPLVYVDFVETAPWNWTISELGRLPVFKGLGSVLIRRAVQQSRAEGFRGRVGLHALPQAERFYGQVCGMTRVGPDAAKQDLVYFEFTRQQADAFISGGGDR